MWRRRKQNPEPVRRPVESPVGDECEAWLAGQLAAYLEGTGRTIPPVGWLNHVVHATVDELTVQAAGRVDAEPLASWPRAMRYLARSVLNRSEETGRPVAELQAGLLLPLELQLIGDPLAAQLDPADLIRLTLTRLYELPELSI